MLIYEQSDLLLEKAKQQTTVAHLYGKNQIRHLNYTALNVLMSVLSCLCMVGLRSKQETKYVPKYKANLSNVIVFFL